MNDNDRIELSCESCGATIVLEPRLRSARCLYCDSPAVISRPVTPDRPHPTFVVGFVVDETAATRRLRDWLRGKLMAPEAIRSAAFEHVQGVYLPTYLYAGVAETDYQAQIGEDYYQTETSTDSEGRTTTRRVRRTEYRELRGKHACYVADVVVTASTGVDNPTLEAVEPFDLRALIRYTPAVVSGWICEEPSMPQAECLRMAVDESRVKVGGKLPAFMPGDSHRNLRYRTAIRDAAIDLTLLPVWIFTIRYHQAKPPLKVLVNGQTGRVGTAKVPLSWLKIVVLGGVGAGLVAMLVALAGWLG